MANLSEILLESAQAGVRMACPFCGSHQALLVEVLPYPDGPCPVQVECLTCSATGPIMQGGEAAVEGLAGEDAVMMDPVCLVLITLTLCITAYSCLKLWINRGGKQ